MNQLYIEGLFDPATQTISYIVMDQSSKRCALVDTVLDYDPKSGRTSTASADRMIERVQALEAGVDWILETHAHADHLSAAPYLKEKLGGRIAIGEHIREVQTTFGELFNAGLSFAHDGSQFDHLFCDGERFRIGAMEAYAMHTPGHTPACLTYVVQDDGEMAAFVGDTLFMPDYGTARCDFPGGDAKTLFGSIGKVLGLPGNTRLYMCHDYQPGGRDVAFQSSVADERSNNIHVRNGIGEEDFVAMRKARDATLAMPVLLLPAVQVNMRAGALPPTEENGVRYLKIPLNAL